MRFLFVNTYYPIFLQNFYSKFNEDIKDKSYEDLLKLLQDQLFGDSDFYSLGLQANGHEAINVVANDEILQKKWAQKHRLFIDEASTVDRLSHIRYVSIFVKPSWIEKILYAQIEEYKPDVLYFQDIEYFRAGFIEKLKKKTKAKIIAQKASPISRMDSFMQADLVFTSFPHFVPFFRERGLRAQWLPLAFGERVLDLVDEKNKIYNCTFVGGLSKHHSDAMKILKEAAERVSIDCFGYGKEILKSNSALYKRHHGEVWGKDMYRTLMQSNITLNRHINVAKDNANNMRLFEATGSGAFLLTDQKSNLNDLFEVGTEVAVYESTDDLVEKINYYTSHRDEREKIAQAGQKRTLKDHTFSVRMKQATEHILCLPF